MSTEEVTNEKLVVKIGPEFATAMAKLQGELENVKKDSEGYGYNYSNLASVIASSKEVLSQNGFSVMQPLTSSNDSLVSITTILAHSSGQYIQSDASLAVIEMKKCNKAQGAGASLSYLRRYALQSILGMTSEDNDASSEGPVKKVDNNSSGGYTAKKSTSFRATKKEVAKSVEKTEEKPTEETTTKSKRRTKGF